MLSVFWLLLTSVPSTNWLSLVGSFGSVVGASAGAPPPPPGLTGAAGGGLGAGGLPLTGTSSVSVWPVFDETPPVSYFMGILPRSGRDRSRRWRSPGPP